MLRLTSPWQPESYRSPSTGATPIPATDSAPEHDASWLVDLEAAHGRSPRPDARVPLAESWFEPADTRRFVGYLNRLLLVVISLVTLAGIIGGLVLSDRIRTNERADDRALARAFAQTDVAQSGDRIAASGREAMIIRSTERDELGLVTDWSIDIIAAEVVPDQQTSRRLNSVGGRLVRGSSRFVQSRDSSRDVWWHTAHELADGRLLVVQRKQAAAMATSSAIIQWFIIVWVVVALSLLALRSVLRRRVEVSTSVLMEATEDLQLRGEIRSTVRERLAQVGERPIELRRLANSMLSIETDIKRTKSENQTLLRAAGALGETLEPDAVLSSILEQLELVLGCRRSAILQFDRRLTQRQVLAMRGHGESFAESITSRRPDASLPSVVALRERRPTQVSDTESEIVSPALSVRAKAEGYRSVLAVPLPPILESPTVLIVHKSHPYTYSYDEIALSVTFASIAAAALHNAELFARTDQTLQEQSSQLEAIVEGVDEGILVEAADGTIMYTNASMTSLADSRSGSDETSNSKEFLDEVLCRASGAEEAQQQLDDLRPDGESWVDIELSNPDGTARTHRVRRFVVRDRGGSVLGSGQIWADITRERQLDQMKSGLLAAVSHEFRTPLTLIKGYATTLLAQDVDWSDADRSEFLDLVVTEADRLTSLVTRLLDMRRIDAGMMEIHTRPIRVDELIEDTVGELGRMRHRLILGDQTGVAILADEARFSTALRNLIENAHTYAGPETLIEISSENRGDEVLITVADRGPGIPDSMKQSIFDTFVRGDSRLDAQHSGTGLGLALSRGFIQAHGGRLWVRDRENGGSVFCIAVPLATAPLAKETSTS